MPDRPDIREVLTAPGILGDKRNEILRYCHGELVVQWDDDDWHGYRRIAKHWETYRGTGKASVLTVQAVHNLERHSTTVVSASSWRCGGFPGTLAHPRTMDPAYPAFHVGEDTAAVLTMVQRGQVVAIDNHPCDYLRFIHGGNSYPPDHYQRLVANGSAPTVEVEAAIAGVQWLRRKTESMKPCRLLEDVSTRLAGLKWMRLKQAMRLAEMYHGVPNANILEVGHLYGVSTCYFALMARQHAGVVVSVDLPQAAHFAPRAEETLSVCGLSADLLRHAKGSRGILPGLADRSFGLAYIDGSHEEANVLFDLQQASRLVVPGGVIVVDDLDHPTYTGVRRAWESWVQFRSQPSWEESGVGFAVA